MGWLATLFMGFVLGLLGGGGGILTVPILVGFFGIATTAATGDSLFVVGLTSVVGAVQGFIKKQTELASGIMIAIPSMIGAFTARKIIVPMIPKMIFGLHKDQVTLAAFAILMIVVGIRMLMKKKEAEEATYNVATVWFR